MKKLYIYFPILLPSLNVWNTTHYMVQNNIKQENKKIVDEILKDYKDVKFNKVKLSFQTFLGTETDLDSKTGKKKRNGTSRDIINNSPTIKLVEDCIVTAGILDDDDAKNVVSHVIHSNIVDREFRGTGVLVLIEEASEKDYDISKHFDKKIKPLSLLSDFKKEMKKQERIKKAKRANFDKVIEDVRQKRNEQKNKKQNPWDSFDDE